MEGRDQYRVLKYELIRFMFCLIAIVFVSFYTKSEDVPFYFKSHIHLSFLEKEHNLIFISLVFLLTTNHILKNSTYDFDELLKNRNFHTFLLILSFIFILFLSSRFLLLPDEYAPRFQAQVFSQGKIFWSFSQEFVKRIVAYPWAFYVNEQTGQIASAYWPGQSLIMAPLAILGWEKAINPILAFICLFYTYKIVESFEKGYGIYACLFLILSPVFIVHSATYYALTGIMCFNTIFFYLMIKERYFLAGIIGGYTLIYQNPYPHLLICIPWIFDLIRTRKNDLLKILPGYILFGLIIGFGWPLFFEGSGFLKGASNIDIFNKHTNSVSIIEKLWKSLMASLIFSRMNSADLYTFFINKLLVCSKFLIWMPIGSIFLIKIGIDFKSKKIRLLFYSFLLNIFGYFFYYWSPDDGSPNFGYRYFSYAFPVLAVFFALSMAKVKSKIHHHICLICSVVILPIFIYYSSFFKNDHESMLLINEIKEEKNKKKDIIVFSVRPWMITPYPNEKHITYFYSSPCKDYEMTPYNIIFGVKMCKNIYSDQIFAQDKAFMAQHYPSATLIKKDETGSVWKIEK